MFPKSFRAYGQAATNLVAEVQHDLEGAFHESRTGLRYIGSVDVTLHPIEARVIGVLIEKEITTPEYYPLSLNALVNACNQKSNRDPVVSFDEDVVVQAIDTLRDKRLASVVTGAGSRVAKYAHRFSETLNLGRRETAILCELLLRGPQTLGELRTRTERLHRFDDLSEVEAVIEHMPEMVTKLPRRPAEKESRYAHLFSGPVDVHETVTEIPQAPRLDRTAMLEAEISLLKEELQRLKEQFAEFRRQFE